MAYERTTWENGVTPINAANLNNLEEGVSERIVKKLLWQNASPTSTFAPQNIMVKCGDYDKIEIEYKLYSTAEIFQTVKMSYISGGKITLCDLSSMESSGVYIQFNSRSATIYSDRVVFGTGVYKAVNLNNFTSNNGYIIPTKIYGIKGVQ